jgi:type IV secretion system protein VirB4
MNPTLLLDEPRGKEWFAKWIEILLTAHGYTLNAEDSQAIWQGIEQISTIPRGLRRLQSLKLSIPTHLGIQLDPWLGDGPLARFFDHTEDAFSLSNFTSMEMGGLFEFPAAARAFMDYAFHQINKSLDGSPTLIYVEEAWFMLEDEGFAMKINDWLRTLAKRNAILMMATQSLKEIATSRHFNAMIDNIPCKIFLSNPNANTQADLYQGKFGLNDTQLNTIRNLTPKREYYIVTPTFSRKVTAFFPKEILPILDSRSLAQDVFTRHQESGHPNWKDNYYEEMVAQ